MGAAPDQLRTAAGQIRRYFTESFPRHLADEDELAKSLAGMSSIVDRALATMKIEHMAHGLMVSRLVSICATIEQDPRRLGAEATGLARVAMALATELEGHLELEERVIFPAVKHLPEHVRDELRAAMRVRRTYALRAAT